MRISLKISIPQLLKLLEKNRKRAVALHTSIATQRPFGFIALQFRLIWRICWFNSNGQANRKCPNRRRAERCVTNRKRSWCTHMNSLTLEDGHTLYTSIRTRGANNRARYTVFNLALAICAWKCENPCAIENLSSENSTDLPIRTHFAFCLYNANYCLCSYIVLF